LIVSVVLAALLAIAGGTIATAFGLQVIEDSMAWLPVAVLLAATVQTLENWHIREQKFGALARTSVLQAAFAGCARTLGGVLGPSAQVLIVLSVAAQLVQSAALFRSASGTISRYRERLRVAPRRARTTMRLAARRYRDFPGYRAPQLLLNFVSRSAPVILLAGIFGAKEAGLYAIAQTVVYLPFTLVAQSIGQVLLQRFSSEVNNRRGLVRPVIQATAVLGLIGIVPFGLLAFMGPWLFGMGFGSEWVEAGHFARWLTIWVFFHFINVPAVQALVVGNSQGILLGWEVVTTPAKLALLIAVGSQTEDAVATIAAYSVFGAIAYIVLILLGFSRAARYERDGRDRKRQF
jgi:O-antigen/teichoic acid export membrane protein